MHWRVRPYWVPLQSPSNTLLSPLANQKASGVRPEQVPPNPQMFLSEEHHAAVPGCYWGLWRALRKGWMQAPVHAAPGRGVFSRQQTTTWTRGPVSAAP